MKGATDKKVVLKSSEEQRLIGFWAKFWLNQSCPSFFSTISTTFMTNIWQNLWEVFHLSQVALDGFDQNLAKSVPLLFVILAILNAIYGPIVHCVSKNLTPRRILKKCFLIAKINHWNNSFPRVCMTCYSQKMTVWPGKLILSKKKPKIIDNFSDWLSLEGSGGQTDETRLTFRVPLKIFSHGKNSFLRLFFSLWMKTKTYLAFNFPALETLFLEH